MFVSANYFLDDVGLLFFLVFLQFMAYFVTSWFFPPGHPLQERPAGSPESGAESIQTVGQP